MTTTITLNNTEIERLITCPKIFKTAPPKLPTLQNRNLNLKFKVYSADNDDEFLVFFSRSAKMLLDFLWAYDMIISCYTAVMVFTELPKAAFILPRIMRILMLIYLVKQILNKAVLLNPQIVRI